MKRLWTALRSLLPLLPASTRWYLVGYAVAASFLAVVDVAALSLLALTLAPMLQGNPVSLPLLGEVPSSGYVWVLTGIGVLILLKGLLTLLLNWTVSRRLASYELLIGDRLFNAYILSLIHI